MFIYFICHLVGKISIIGQCLVSSQFYSHILQALLYSQQCPGNIYLSARCLTVLICHSIALAACCLALGSLSTIGLSERSCCKQLPAGVEETPLFFLVCSQSGLEYVAGCKSKTLNKWSVELMSCLCTERPGHQISGVGCRKVWRPQKHMDYECFVFFVLFFCNMVGGVPNSF